MAPRLAWPRDDVAILAFSASEAAGLALEECGRALLAGGAGGLDHLGARAEGLEVLGAAVAQEVLRPDLR